MKTIKEITSALKAAEEWQDWMKEIAADERAGVQKAWLTWQKRQDKTSITARAPKKLHSI